MRSDKSTTFFIHGSTVIFDSILATLTWPKIFARKLSFGLGGHLPLFPKRKADLFRIARNLIIDSKRKKKEVRIENYQEIEATSDLDEEIDKKQQTQKIEEALGKLKAIERQIVILRYFEEMTITEVAKVVGTREGALRVRIHRILKKLKEILEND